MFLQTGTPRTVVSTPWKVLTGNINSHTHTETNLELIGLPNFGTAAIVKGGHQPLVQSVDLGPNLPEANRKTRRIVQVEQLRVIQRTTLGGALRRAVL